jgi:uncharacterized protein (AIM24 family)
MNDLNNVMERDENSTIKSPLLGSNESMHVSKSTMRLEDDLLSKVDELVMQQENEEKRDEDTTKRRLSDTFVQPEALFVDLTNEDIDMNYVKAPSPNNKHTIPPIPASLKDAKLQGTSKQLPPLPALHPTSKFKPPPPIPSHLRKINFDIEFEIVGEEQQAVTIMLKGPSTKCMAPTTTEILCMSTGIEMKTLDKFYNVEITNHLLHETERAVVAFGIYSMRQFVNPKLTDTPLEVTLYRPVEGKIARVEVHNTDVLIKKGSLICAVPQPSETTFENYISISNVESQTDGSITFERATGLGFVFLQCSGSLVSKTLVMGQEMLLRSQAIIAMESTITYTNNDERDVENMDLKVSGPGVIYLQTRP